LSIPFSRLVEDQVIIRPPAAPEAPLVSIIMPTYKLREEGRMNRKAIESVLGQTFRDYELILIDDGSLDGLFDMLKEYQKQDARITIIRHEINCGLPAARVDEGLLLARGRYATYMFEDDSWFPDALENLLNCARTLEEPCLVYGEVEWDILNPDGEHRLYTLGDWDFDYAALREENRFANCAVLHSMSMIHHCGMYDPNILLRRASDYDLWLRAGREVRIQRCLHRVGHVSAGTKHALGATIDQDLALTYRMLNSSRNAGLLPEKIMDYCVDAIPFATSVLDAARILDHYILPFWVQHPRILTAAERDLALANRETPNRMLVTKGSFSTSIDVTLGNYSTVLPSEVQSFGFMPERNLSLVDFENFDTLLLYKTIGSSALVATQQARNHNKTIIYLMDDHMFKFGTGYMAEQNDYLKPDSPYFKNLEMEVSLSDLVISYSPKITEDVRKYNPRVVELKTNIPRRYVLAASPLAGGRATGRCIKYALLSGPARRKEVEQIWGQLAAFFSQHKDEVEFHMWGMNPADFGSLDCPVHYRPFDNSYTHYLTSLQVEKFDFVICPLFDDHETKLSKSPIKFLEAAAAGAVGIYSAAAAYAVVEDGKTGLLVKDNLWLEALEASLSMRDEERTSLFDCARDFILTHYTSEAQVLSYLSAFEAADLHAQLRSYNTPSGRAKIAYFVHETLLGGATLHLLDHARLAKKYGFEPVFCYPMDQRASPEFNQLIERSGFPLVQLEYQHFPWLVDLNPEAFTRAHLLADWLQANEIRMVHMVTYSGEVSWAAACLGIPCAITLHAFYETPSEFTGHAAKIKTSRIRQIGGIHSSSFRYLWRWQKEIHAPGFCIRAPISAAYFEQYQHIKDRQIGAVPTVLVSGTLQPRKRQLEAIRAVKLLADEGIKINLYLLGYDNVLPDYARRCRDEIQKAGLEDQVKIPGFSLDPKPYYDQADYILCSSDDESMPQSILKAMAEGRRVITTPVGGVREVVLDGFSGVVADGAEPVDLARAIKRAVTLSTDQWQQMLENAQGAARMTCHEDVVSYELLRFYNTVVRERIRLTANSLGISMLAPVNKGMTFLTIEGEPVLNSLTMPEQVFIRPMIFIGLVYRVHVPQDSWNGLVLAFATYKRSVKSDLKVEIRNASFPFTLVRSFEIKKSQLEDNLPVTLTFPPIYGLAGLDVLIRIRPKSAVKFPILGVYEKGRRPDKFRRLFGSVIGKGGNLSGVMIFSPNLYYQGRGMQTDAITDDEQVK
jgi:glycosyltransferase involved in cell wall biosynthesis